MHIYIYTHTYTNSYIIYIYNNFSGAAAKVRNLGRGLRAELGLPAPFTQKDLVVAMEHEAWDDTFGRPSLGP